MSTQQKRMVRLLARASGIDVAISREGSALWLEVTGVVTRKACKELMSVLRAELDSTPAVGVAIDFRRTIWAIGAADMGHLGSTTWDDPIKPPIAFVVPPGAVAPNLQSAYVKFMAEHQQERSFFEEPSLARLHLAHVARRKTKTATRATGKSGV